MNAPGPKPAAGFRSAAVLAAISALACGCAVPPPTTGRLAMPDAAATGSDLEIDRPWTGWDDFREPLVPFDELAGWQVVCDGGKTATLERQRLRQGSPHHVARLFTAATGTVAEVVLRPPAPIAIGEAFDTIELWLGRPETSGADAPASEPSVDVLFAGPDGAEQAVPMGRFAPGRWVLQHRRLERAARVPVPPGRFRGLRITGWQDAANRDLFLNDLTFYLQSDVPIVPAWRREGFVFHSPVEYSLAGTPSNEVATGAGGWSPRPAATPSGARLYREADGRWRLKAAAGGSTVAWRIDPRMLESGVTCALEGGPERRLASLSWRTEDDGAGAVGAPVAEWAEEGVLRAVYGGGLTLAARAEGAALILTLSSRVPDRSGLVATPEGGTDVAPLRVPFLNDLPGGPPLWRFTAGTAAGTNRAVFASAWFDPLYSRSAGPVEAEQGASGRTAAAPSPIGVRYPSATDGRRACLRERLVFAVSPRIEDVLPRMRTAAPTNRVGSAAYWMDGEGAEAAAAELAVAFPGVDCRRPAPAPAPAAGPWSFLGAADALFPGSAYWARDALRHDASDQWVPAEDPGGYGVKPAFVRLWMEDQDAATPAGTTGPMPVVRLARVLAEPPWRFTDYDARVRDPANAAAALYALRGALRAAAGHGWGVVAPDDFAPYYAAAVDGLLVGARRGEILRADPPLPLFALRELRPKLALYGAGPPPSPSDGPGAVEREYRYLATELAYGLCARLPAGEEAAAGRDRLRTVALLQAIEQRVSDAPLEQIAYADGDRLVSTSEAIAGGAVAAGRLYLRYGGPTELWVNLGRETTWPARVGVETFRLPPGGWLARGPGLFAAALTAGERRVDVVESADYAYFDGHGSAASFRGFAGAGPVYFRRLPDAGRGDVLEVTDLAGAGPAAWPATLGAPRADSVTGVALADGAEVTGSLTRQGDTLRLETSGIPARYLLPLPGD